MEQLGERGLGFYRNHPRVEPMQGEGVIPNVRADVKAEITCPDELGIKPGEAANPARDGVVGEERAEQRKK